MIKKSATSPTIARVYPDPTLRRLHAEMTELWRILPANDAPTVQARPGPPMGEAETPSDFSDMEDLFDNCPL